jgi:heptose I phosphotransferase
VKGEGVARGSGDRDLVELDQGRIAVRTPYLSLFHSFGWTEFEAVMAFAGGQLWKEQGGRSVFRLSLEQQGREETLFLKRHLSLKGKGATFHGLRGRGLISGARREWDNIERLRRLGIGTVEPVAFGERKRWGWNIPSFLLTRELKDACRLSEFFPQRYAPPLSSSILAEKRGLIRNLGSLVARMHGAGLFHRDLYLGHFFLRPRDGGEHELFLLDLQRVIRPCLLVERWRVKDLASLNFSAPPPWFSASDRLRFFLVYRQKRRLDGEDKSLVHRILRKSKRIRDHTRRLLERGEIQNPPWGWEKDAA